MKKYTIEYIAKRTVAYFFQGMLLLAPIGLTIAIIGWMFNYVDEAVQKVLPHTLQIPGVGIIIMALIIAVLGYLSSKILFTFIFKNVDELLERIPVVKVIYTSARDFLQAFLGKEKRFNKPVLVKINSTDEIQRIGFVTQTDLTELGIPDGKSAVYIPHSYNFSGNVMIVPNTHIEYLPDADAAELMKFIVSGGVTKLGD